MRNLILLSLLVSMTGLAYANCGNGNGNGNGCSDSQGPQGEPGLNGTNGTNGTDGVNGTSGTDGKDGNNGVNGSNGRDGKDGRDTSVNHEHAAVIDTAIRLYDGKRVQLQAFNVYRLGLKPGQDIFGNGYNMMVGARVIFKLGSSYEEREIARLRKQLGLK